MRLKAAFLSVLISLSLCGCGVYKEADMQYTVAALGFEGGSTVSVYAEIITVNPESTKQETGNLLASAQGETVKEAISSLKHSLSKPLFFSHCGLICLGESLKANRIKEILDYCYENDEINHSVYFISSDNTEELLSLSSQSEMATGYDIMGVIRQAAKAECVDYNNRYYEIEAVRQGVQDIFSLPIFKVQDGSPLLNGIRIYKNCEKTNDLTNEETYSYYLLRDLTKKGSIITDGKTVKITSKDDDFGVSLDEKLHISLETEIGFKGNEEFISTVQKQSEELIKKSIYIYKTDIFGFGARIHKRNEKLWNKIGENYSEFYLNSDISFKLTGRN